MKPVRCLSLFIVLVLWGCQGADQLPSNEYSKIVFLSNRDAPKGQFDIFMMNLDGSGQTNLTKGLHSVRSISRPQLSPDQKKILFVAFEQSGAALQLFDVATDTVWHLTEVGLDVPQACFSPRGDQILFVKRIAGHKQICVINSDGSNERNLSNNDVDEFDPTFSGDGKKIAFVSTQSGSKSIWIMNSDGSHRRLLPKRPGNAGHPRFSPDGRKLVFHVFNKGSNDIYLADLGRNSVKPLYESKANDINPRYSPVGNKVLFLSNARGMKYQDVCVYDFAKGAITVVSDRLNYINQNPTFSPDGKYIVFESILFGNSEVYRVDPDGNHLTNLTNDPRWDCAPTL